MWTLLLAMATLARTQDVDSDSYTNEDSFETTMLEEHNRFRLEHDAKPLIWNDTLAAFADAHNQDCVFGHSKETPGYGENLAAGYANATATVDAWGNERRKYNFDKPGFSTDTGHFTQMVWNTTEQVGCAVKGCEGILEEGSDSWYVTCEYFPQGNVEGEYDAHVNKGIYNAGERKSPNRLFMGLLAAATGVWLQLGY